MSEKKRTFNLLVLDGNSQHNWVELFENRTLSDGSTLRVVQASWNEVSVTSYPDASGMQASPPDPIHFEANSPVDLIKSEYYFKKRIQEIQ